MVLELTIIILGNSYRYRTSATKFRKLRDGLDMKGLGALNYQDLEEAIKYARNIKPLK